MTNSCILTAIRELRLWGRPQNRSGLPLQVDPHEMQNLAVDIKPNGDLLLAKNQKMIDVIDAEVGDDDGSFLPEKGRLGNHTFRSLTSGEATYQPAKDMAGR